MGRWTGNSNRANIYTQWPSVYPQSVENVFFFCYLHLVWFASDTEVLKFSRGCQPLLPRGSYTTGRVHQPPCDVFMFLHTMFLHTVGDIPGSFPDSSYTIHISHEGNSVLLSDTIRGLGVEPQDYFSLSGEVTPYVYTVLVAPLVFKSWR